MFCIVAGTGTPIEPGLMPTCDSVTTRAVLPEEQTQRRAEFTGETNRKNVHKIKAKNAATQGCAGGGVKIWKNFRMRSWSWPRGSGLMKTVVRRFSR